MTNLAETTFTLVVFTQLHSGLVSKNPADTSHGKRTARLRTEDNEHPGNSILTINNRQQHDLMTTSHTKQSFQLSLFTGAQHSSQEVQTIEQCLPRPLHSLPFNRSLFWFLSVCWLKFKGLIFASLPFLSILYRTLDLQGRLFTSIFIHCHLHRLIFPSKGSEKGCDPSLQNFQKRMMSLISSSSFDSIGGHLLIRFLSLFWVTASLTL